MSMDNEQDFQGQKVDLKLWKRLFRYALRNKKALVQDIIALVIVAVIDALYPYLTRFAIDTFVNPGGEPSTNGVWIFGISYAVLILVQSFFTMLFIKRSGDIEMSFGSVPAPVGLWGADFSVASTMPGFNSRFAWRMARFFSFLLFFSSLAAAPPSLPAIRFSSLPTKLANGMVMTR